MQMMGIFKDRVGKDLKLSLEDLYLLGYFYKQSTIASETKIINNKECFTINLVDIFKNRIYLFESVTDSDDKELIKKIYERNRKKLDRLLKGELKKVIIKEKVIKTKEGSNTYYRLDKKIIKILIDGYPTKESREFTEKEKLVMQELKIDILSNSISKQLESMEINVLKDSIIAAKENGILDYAYVKAIYNNLIQSQNLDNKKVATTGNSNNSCENTTNSIRNVNTIISNNKENYNYKLNPKVHNYSGSANFMKYNPEELEKILQESQKGKF